MRLFWTGVLATGLLLIGLSTYERQESLSEPESATASSAMGEDGTPFPQPYPTPTPKP
jgi:hypothetical protein